MSTNYAWEKAGKKEFGASVLQATHNAHESEQFSDEKLAELLDMYPREQLGIYKFPEHSDGVVKADHGRAPKLSGAQILNAVKTGQIWLNLRAVNRHVPAFSDLSDDTFSQLEQAFGVKTLKQDVGVLMSSPNIHVHYHLDIPLVTLVQLRGEKTLHLYPAKAPYRTTEAVEKIVRRTQDEELYFEHSFEDAARAIKLVPGMAITWPQTAPHRVQNSDSMNVSLSCEFMTMPAILRANAVYGNGLLRDKLGVKASYPETVGIGTMAKAALARLTKKLAPIAEKSPTPITFELMEDGEISYFPSRRVTDFPIVTANSIAASSPALLTCRMKAPAQLTDAEVSDWRALQASCWNFDTPLLSPDFAKLIATSRKDVRCGLIYEGDVLQAVIAGHLNGRGEMIPLGAPLCDYTGPMIRAEASVTAEQVLKLAEIVRYKTSFAIIPKAGRRQSDKNQQDYGHVIALNGQSPEVYLEAHRAANAKRFKNMRRLLNKMERDLGPIEFFHGTPSIADFKVLMAWKSDQFKSEGLLDITQAAHARRILDAALLQTPIQPADLGGFFTGLKVNGKLVAGHFGIRQGENFHPWISAYDPASEEYSPGVLFLYRCVEEMNTMGLQIYDLAEGHDSYKKYFAEPLRAVAKVSYADASGVGNMYRASDKVWQILGDDNTVGVTARLRRRLTMSRYCEPSVIKRALDVLTAVKKRGASPSM